MGEARMSARDPPPPLPYPSGRADLNVLLAPRARNIRPISREQVYICKREVSLYSFARETPRPLVPLPLHERHGQTARGCRATAAPLRPAADLGVGGRGDIEFECLHGI